MSKKITCIPFIILLLAGCHLPGNKVDKLWFYTYSEVSSGNRDTTLNPTNFIELREDGTYSRDFGKFEYGSWQKTKNRIVLTNFRKEISTLDIVSLKMNELQLRSNNRQVDIFENQPQAVSAAKDPFSKNNNLWRIPADRKESDKEIQFRLLNHLKYWELYFTWALDNDLQSIDVRSLPSLIKIYGNGFTIKPYNALPEKWKAYFYDEEDCRKANGILEDILANENIAWPNTDNKFKAFISVFQQLEEMVRG